MNWPNAHLGGIALAMLLGAFLGFCFGVYVAVRTLSALPAHAYSAEIDQAMMRAGFICGLIGTALGGMIVYVVQLLRVPLWRSDSGS